MAFFVLFETEIAKFVYWLMVTITTTSGYLFLNLYERGFTTNEAVTLTFQPISGLPSIEYTVTPISLTERYAEIELPSTFNDDVADGQYLLKVDVGATNYFSEICQVDKSEVITTTTNNITLNYSVNGTI